MCREFIVIMKMDLDDLFTYSPNSYFYFIYPNAFVCSLVLVQYPIHLQQMFKN